MAAMRRAIFLDRDGVINRNEVREGRPYSPDKIEDFVILAGVAEAVAAFRAAGYLTIVATNQPDVGAGRIARALVDEMHALMQRAVPLDDIRVCYHTDADKCDCRKPKPGMLLDAAAAHGIALDQSWMIGDRWRDVAAGRAAGCRTVLIDYGYYGEPPPEQPDIVVRSLTEAVPRILERTPSHAR